MQINEWTRIVAPLQLVGARAFSCVAGGLPGIRALEVKWRGRESTLAGLATVVQL